MLQGIRQNPAGVRLRARLVFCSAPDRRHPACRRRSEEDILFTGRRISPGLKRMRMWNVIFWGRDERRAACCQARSRHFTAEKDIGLIPDVQSKLTHVGQVGRVVDTPLSNGCRCSCHQHPDRRKPRGYLFRGCCREDGTGYHSWIVRARRSERIGRSAAREVKS